jgi:hypothetical protein
LQAAIFKAGMVPVHREIVVEGVTIQAAESLTGNPARRVYRWQAGAPIGYITKPVNQLPPPPPPPPPPVGELINVLSYLQAHPAAWRVVYNVTPDGRRQGQDIRDMDLGGGCWVRAKNTLAEWWRQDGQHAYLIRDSSPLDINGRKTCYTISKGGVVGASPKNPAQMAINQTWQETGAHFVQFYYMSDCAKITTPPTGNNTNWSKLLWRNASYKFAALPVTFDVIALETTNGEIQLYAKINAESAARYNVPAGLSLGWVGWESAWGRGEFEELYFDRGQLAQEPAWGCG